MIQEIIFTAASTFMDTNLLYASPQMSIEISFEHLFKNHFKALHSYAFTILKDEIIAEEIVQNVFCRLWEKREQMSAKAYLYRSMYNESLNHLKHEKVKANYQNYAARSTDMAENAGQKMIYTELEIKLDKAINKLPQQC